MTHVSANLASCAALAFILVSASLCLIEAKPFGIGIEINRRKPKQREFDYFNLALQWPATYCQRTRHCCPNNTCCRGSNSPSVFTIQKHGTCSAPVTGDEYNYFLTTLNVYFKYNVTKVLNEAGYVPSNTEKYPLGGIISAIQNAFHATPKLACKNGAVEALNLCFYKDFKPRDCLVGSSSSSYVLSSSNSCPKYVSLPAYASLGASNAESEHPYVTDAVM